MVQFFGGFGSAIYPCALSAQPSISILIRFAFFQRHLYRQITLLLTSITRNFFYSAELVFYKRNLCLIPTSTRVQVRHYIRQNYQARASQLGCIKYSGNPRWNCYFFLASLFFFVLLDFLGGYCLTWSSLWTEGLSASNSMVTDSPNADLSGDGNDAPTSQLSPFK